MEQLFTEYADKDDRSYIGSEGLEGLCVAAKIPMDGPQTLILAWLLDAKEFGKLTKEEWCCALNPMKQALNMFPLFFCLIHLTYQN